MNKQTYLIELRQALSGLAPDQIADVLSDYEQHFMDAVNAGRAEDEVANAMGDPKKIALEFVATMQVQAFHESSSVGNFFRMLASFVALASVNFILLPWVVTVYLFLLSFYIASISCVLGGAMIVASAVYNPGDFVTAAHAPNQIGIHLPPYSIGYTIQATADVVQSEEAAGSISHTADKANFTDPINLIQTNGGGYRLMFGLLYLIVGLGCYIVSRRLSKITINGIKQYLSLNRQIHHKLIDGALNK